MKRKKTQETGICGRQRGSRKAVCCLALLLFLLAVSGLSACQRYEPAALTEPAQEGEALPETESLPMEVVAESAAASAEEPAPVQVKGIYLAASPVSNAEFMNQVIQHLDDSELNAVVIDVKDDYGRITYEMQNVPLVNELGAVKVTAGDLPGVIARLKEHGVYCIARIVALKDPYIADKKPEWALYRADGSIFRDNAGDAWVNPYKEEYWTYLLDVAREAGRIGFDEIQFDYIRFCTERGIGDVVYDEADTKGRDKISIITELVNYLTEHLRQEGLFVSCDVFGTIIGSSVDAQSVGQDYNQMAAAVDYICPMIYPSHYASGNFGLEHPDREPYRTILGALQLSKRELQSYESYHQAKVRPWLQSFTASYLGEGNYMEYDADAVRQQIQGVYDAGYDEWILWSASANYFYDGLLTEEEGAAERSRIEESREAAQAAEAGSAAEEELPPELASELAGDDLSQSDAAILEQDGPIVSYDKGQEQQP